MERRTSGALRRKALGRILDLFPNDRDVYENWQKYAQIYAMGYKDAPDNMDDIVDYWGSLGHDYNAGFEEGTRRALLRIALSIVNNAIKHGESEGYLSIKFRLAPLRNASRSYIYYTLASNRPRRNVSKLPNRILSKKKLMMTTKIL